MDRKARLKQLRSKRALAQAALEKSDTEANRIAFDDAEAELANAESDAKDDERLAAVTSGLLPLVEALSKNAVEPTKSWVQCVRVAVAQLEDAQRAKKDGSALDPDRLASQAEALIEAVTRLRPT
jgi:hypothetical protein